MKKIACLHAHPSNIALLSAAFAMYDVELVHFVDADLLLPGDGPAASATEQAYARLRQQLKGMDDGSVDAIVITCTQYASYLTAEAEAACAAPVFTIDGPFIQELSRTTERHLLVFSNPATVEPTMSRIRKQAQTARAVPAIELLVVEDAFTLLMENRQEAYLAKLTAALHDLDQTLHGVPLSVAQLSMAPAAERFARETGRFVAHPLHSLTSQLVQTLALSEKHA
ncbi:hypothetical protein BAG01nite_22650 [Brevibacillus agri]|uniref:Asp/Glu racemase n=2 Tax=Brevibacillus agri TaxID=51101 RepID=A0A3M8AVI6_9BACL|nr:MULTISPECIES: hypothetical protein [Brevibacillus]ELK40942.1 hypothetical protein D478_16724 [Brevibacillus agri BAB-2500]MBY0051075.1 hypothetical protein [Brevibacillus agri]QAV13321.1 hypothetical protein BA6348_11550 [Brevibacillus agri]QHZ55928.1 hypothetical protein M655_009940 [Brevibacillus sp. NSP2.1]RNB55206.1 hypothetical protein EB820_12350 [Brevibacillus agri]